MSSTIISQQRMPCMCLQNCNCLNQNPTPFGDMISLFKMNLPTTWVFWYIVGILKRFVCATERTTFDELVFPWADDHCLIRVMLSFEEGTKFGSCFCRWVFGFIQLNPDLVAFIKYPRGDQIDHVLMIDVGGSIVKTVVRACFSLIRVVLIYSKFIIARE
jgi:hypothetical protein